MATYKILVSEHESQKGLFQVIPYRKSGRKWVREGGWAGNLEQIRPQIELIYPTEDKTVEIFGQNQQLILAY